MDAPGKFGAVAVNPGIDYGNDRALAGDTGFPRRDRIVKHWTIGFAIFLRVEAAGRRSG